MTRIDFYFNVVDKPQAIANLVEIAMVKQRQVCIMAEEKMASQLSTFLWQNQPVSFLPNVQTTHLHAVRTPVVIGLQADDFKSNHIHHDDMLINLSTAEPNFFSRYTQLVELVGEDEQDKILARARFKFYRDRGYEIKSIDHAQLNTK